MTSCHDKYPAARVSVMLPTYNRRNSFRHAIASALRQYHNNVQVVVVNDGGDDVSDIVKSFDDERICHIDRKQNRGKAYSLNEGLAEAKGEYVAYLDDDDMFYPNHLSALVNAMENRNDIGLAYSMLYRTKCRTQENGQRLVLSKMVDISRDFDRWFMLYYNHVLHVSMMHRKELLEKTGGYNEDIDVLIDWDMTRRMCFFTDFYHVKQITGEYYSPIDGGDRLSIRQRRDEKKYLKNVLAIRNTRPPKPWTKIKDLSIIYAPKTLDKNACQTIGTIWGNTFYPYQLYLPLTRAEMEKFDAGMPNVVTVEVEQESAETERINRAIGACKGDYVAVVSTGLEMPEMWLERSLYALINCGSRNDAYRIETSDENAWGFVAEKSVLENAMKTNADASVQDCLTAAGVKIRQAAENELPFKFDRVLAQAQINEQNGNWIEAAKLYEYISENFREDFWMRSMQAAAYFKGGYAMKAQAICQDINRSNPTVDTLLTEAKVSKKNKDFCGAISLLNRAEDILEGKQLQWT